MPPASEAKPFKFTLRHLFAVVAAAAAVSLGIYYFNWLQERDRHLVCESNLQTIGLAIQGYEATLGCFPPPYVTDAQGKPLYSWRVLILPYLEEVDLYDQWRKDEPWDSPHNSSLPIPSVYSCPVAERNQGARSPYTDYLAVVGPGAAWEEGKCLMPEDFVDGIRDTIMLVEVRGSQIHWAEPVDFDGTGTLQINARQGLPIRSHGANRANVSLGDANLVHLSDAMPEEQIRALLTRSGGENQPWCEEGRINDYWFGDLHWIDKSWEGTYKCVDRELPFSIDIDAIDPTDEQKAFALVAARKVRRYRTSWALFLDAPWEEKTRLDAAKGVLEALQSDDVPIDKDLPQLADDMTLRSWGITYSIHDGAVFPYLVYTSSKCLPNSTIRVRFSTKTADRKSGEVTVIDAIDEVTVNK